MTKYFYHSARHCLIAIDEDGNVEYLTEIASPETDARNDPELYTESSRKKRETLLKKLVPEKKPKRKYTKHAKLENVKTDKIENLIDTSGKKDFGFSREKIREIIEMKKYTDDSDESIAAQCHVSEHQVKVISIKYIHDPEFS